MEKQKLNSTFIAIIAGFAIFLATFNETFLNVAFNGISATFAIETSTVQWLATAYMLAAAVMVPVSAFLYRKLPTKVLFSITVLLLIIGSVVGGLANNFTILLIGRIIQALGSGMLIPICMNITLAVAPKNKLGFYLGVMGAMTTLGPSLSIIVSGLLLSAFDWHILLWSFGGLCLILLILEIIGLKNVATLSNPKLDILSVILISVALIGLLYGISTILSGAIVIAVISLVVGLACLFLFGLRQRKIDEPLIDLTPFKVPEFTIGVILNMVALAIVFAMNIVLPMFLQDCLNASEFNSSLTLFPAIFLACIVSPIAGKIYDKYGIKIILPLGFLLMCLFVVGIAFAHSLNNMWIIACLYVPVILGSALVIGPIQTFALSHLDKKTNGAGVTIMSTGFQIAGCIGSSIFVSLYGLMAGERDSITHTIINIETAGNSFLVTSLLVGAVGFIGFILSLVVINLKKKQSNQQVVNNNDAIETHKLNLKDIMNSEVYSINENDTIINAMQIMANHNIGGLPIVNDKGEFVSFISDGDIMRYLSNTYPLFLNAYSFIAMSENDNFDEKLKELMNLKLKDISSNHKIFAKDTDDLSTVCQILSTNKIKKVPVLNDEGKIIGIVNSSSITKYAISVYLKETKI
ncbi:MAG: MFS transporter [Christensenellales bacterium]